MRKREGGMRQTYVTGVQTCALRLEAQAAPVDQVRVRLVEVAAGGAREVPLAQVLARRGEVAARGERHLVRALVEPQRQLDVGHAHGTLAVTELAAPR